MPEEQTNAFDGGCACGEVRYRMLVKPMFVNCCHCRWCQRESGAAFALNAWIETDQITLLQGKPENVDTPSESGAGQVFVRCPTCMVALWSHYSSLGDKVAFVRVGSLDEPDRVPPDANIWTLSKQPWVTLSPDLPSFEKFYDKKEIWSAESLARLQAVLT